MDDKDLIDALNVARSVVTDESAALRRFADSLGESFCATLRAVLESTEEVILTGLGKSGFIARKIAATLTSTGTRALFVHPVEALHGDLGIVTERHCLMALSRSGNTEEILRFATHFRRLGGPVIAVTQSPESPLVELSQHAILLPEAAEAGPLNLAPTTSCALMLAAGDALAMGLLHARGFRREDFAQFHPEGTLGRRLLMRAADAMHDGEKLPCVSADARFADLLVEMTRKRLGLALIVEATGELIGTFTDGDLRRICERVENAQALTASEAHAKSRRSSDAPAVPISTVRENTLAVECLRIMRDEQITSLVVVNDDGLPKGILRLQDLIAHGLG